jgi:hypothetical protein
MLPKSKREFFCELGETITVTVTSQGTVHNVTFAKDGQDWDGQPFVFTKPANEFRSITIFVIFSNPSGGQFDIKIAGKPGEFVHEESVPQDDEFGSVPDSSRGYTFFEI